MKTGIHALVLLLAGEPAAALAAPTIELPAVEVKDSSFKDANGNRVQELSTVVQASVTDVWGAFTTDAGFKRWAVPVAHITLANDGMMESSYSLTGRIGDPDNILNRIVAYLPEKLIVMQNAHVPKGAPFDPVLIATLRTIITFEPVDATHTRVTETQVGYGESAGYDSMYQHFRDGNTYALQTLARSFITGPVDWKAGAGKMAASVNKPKSE
jgi:uncharacterized protein YndB with AHSA1/START domain